MGKICKKRGNHIHSGYSFLKKLKEVVFFLSFFFPPTFFFRFYYLFFFSFFFFSRGRKRRIQYNYLCKTLMKGRQGQRQSLGAAYELLLISPTPTQGAWGKLSATNYNGEKKENKKKKKKAKLRGQLGYFYKSQTFPMQ